MATIKMKLNEGFRQLYVAESIKFLDILSEIDEKDLFSNVEKFTLIILEILELVSF